jgi:hypothetical protein
MLFFVGIDLFSNLIKKLEYFYRHYSGSKTDIQGYFECGCQRIKILLQKFDFVSQKQIVLGWFHG